MIVSLAALVYAAEILVRGSAGAARRIGVSTFFIGLTIVGMGTSAPELATGIAAAVRGNTELCVGNIVGSNICNIARTLGITAMIIPIAVRLRMMRRDIAVAILASFVPYMTIATGGVVIRPLAIMLVLAMVAVLVLSYMDGRKSHTKEAERLEDELGHELGLDRTGFWHTTLGEGIMIVAGLGLLIGASHFFVGSASAIARELGVSDLIIGLTIVAFGTSAPELFTCVIAARRQQADIAIGNLVGSNIFNILGILGIVSLVHPQYVSPQVLWLDAPVMIVVSLAMVPMMISGSRVSRAEGAVLLTVYVLYTIALFTIVPAWFPAGPAS